ncbi:hypothetical protein [Natranaerovirga pectinivora]|nr:hypothetical protein [Natranaerovirga pectinivora]
MIHKIFKTMSNTEQNVEVTIEIDLPESLTKELDYYCIEEFEGNYSFSSGKLVLKGSYERNYKYKVYED